MIQPSAFSDYILYQTVRIECSGYCGTGFIFGFKMDDKNFIPVIITNKHVIDYEPINSVKFSMHLRDKENNVLPNVVNYDWNSEWIFHPNDDVDLCCALLQPMIEEALKNNIDVFYVPCLEELIPANDELEDMQSVNDVLMVGYPNGLFDEKHFLPLVRKGITSSHPAIDYDGQCVGVVDIACFEGSSGSPIYSYPGIYQYRKSTGTMVGTTSNKLLGVLFGGATGDVEGKVTVKRPRQKDMKTSIEYWINLGYYVKAQEILTLISTLMSKYNLQQN